jgi:hypothetical protein
MIVLLSTMGKDLILKNGTEAYIFKFGNVFMNLCFFLVPMKVMELWPCQ